MPEPKASPFRLPSLLTVIVAFALGAGAMWLLAPSQRWPAQSSLTKQSAEPRAEEPPDVSQLAPADAARTLANWNYDQQNWPHAIDHYEKAIAREFIARFPQSPRAQSARNMIDQLEKETANDSQGMSDLPNTKP